MGNNISGLSWTSSILGFISFGLTILTVIGVYRDVYSTIKNAKQEIPLMLANLREEIESERYLLRARAKLGDHFGVFKEIYELANSPNPGNRPQSGKGRKKGYKTDSVGGFDRAFAYHLLQETMRELWEEFKAVERPFLIKNPRRAEAVEQGNYWGDSDVGKDEIGDTDWKQHEKRMNDRIRAAEAGSTPTGLVIQYYNTDFTHRFIWYQSRGAIERLKDMTLRMQIRRMKHDIIECDHLTKRVYCLVGGGETDPDERWWPNGNGGGGGGGDKGGYRSSYDEGDKRRLSASKSVLAEEKRFSAGSIRSNPKANSRRRRARQKTSSSFVRDREVEEREVVRRKKRRPSISPPISRDRGAREGRVQTDVETETIRRPGLVDSDRENARSYVRERVGSRSEAPQRQRSRSVIVVDRDRSRSREWSRTRRSTVVERGVSPARTAGVQTTRYSVARRDEDEIGGGRYEVVQPGMIYVDLGRPGRDEFER